jgi:serine/threonine-protein kinase HipA
LGIRSDGGFRLSLAGAQEKAAFLWKDGQWCRPIGTTPTTHIFKPQIGKIEMSTGTIDLSQSVENEFYCLELLRAFGLDVAQAEIDQFGEKTVLIVERFDRLIRRDGGILRLPQEDMCQALGVPPTLKYQNVGGPKLVDILTLLSRSDTPLEDQRTVYMSQILFWLIGATDGHAKNFSIFLRPNNQMALTPLYDVISAQPMFDARQIPHKDFKLAMSVGQKSRYKIQEIRRRHFHQTAVEAGLENMSADQKHSFTTDAINIIQTRFTTAFENVLTRLPQDFPIEIHESIRSAASARLETLHSNQSP